MLVVGDAGDDLSKAVGHLSGDLTQLGRRRFLPDLVEGQARIVNNGSSRHHETVDVDVGAHGKYIADFSGEISEILKF